jgi:hypothetical protein
MAPIDGQQQHYHQAFGHALSLHINMALDRMFTRNIAAIV